MKLDSITFCIYSVHVYVSVKTFTVVTDTYSFDMEEENFVFIKTEFLSSMYMYVRIFVLSIRMCIYIYIPGTCILEDDHNLICASNVGSQSPLHLFF